MFNTDLLVHFNLGGKNLKMYYYMKMTFLYQRLFPINQTHMSVAINTSELLEKNFIVWYVEISLHCLSVVFHKCAETIVKFGQSSCY